MPDDPQRYEPKYVTVSDVPIEIPDNYTDAQKREALFGAETDLELDRRGGDEIPDDELRNIHIQAITNLATHYLARSATNPSDVTLGELEDGGDEKEDHAYQYLNTYKECLNKMAEAKNGQPGTYFGATGDPGRTIAANTGPGARRHDLNRPVRGSDFDRISHNRFTSDN